MLAIVTPILIIQTTTLVNIADILLVATTTKAKEQTSLLLLSYKYTQIVK